MQNLKKRMENDAIDALSKPNPSIKDIRDVLKIIIEKMWSEQRLAEYIHQVHDALCADCPHMKAVAAGGGGEAVGKLSGKVVALISSLVAAVVALSGVVAKMALGGGAS